MITEQEIIEIFKEIARCKTSDIPFILPIVPSDYPIIAKKIISKIEEE